MSLFLEWRTKKLDDSQKEGLEGEIKNKIGWNIEQFIEKIVLCDDAQGNYLVIGNIFYSTGPEAEKSCRITIDTGLFIECHCSSLFNLSAPHPPISRRDRSSRNPTGLKEVAPKN